MATPSELTNEIFSEYGLPVESPLAPEPIEPFALTPENLQAAALQYSQMQESRPAGERFQGTMAKLARGPSLGTSDRLAPALLASIDMLRGQNWSDAYQAERAALRSDIEGFEEANPYGGLLELAGGLASLGRRGGIATLEKGRETLANPRLLNMLRGTLLGGGQGAIYGASTAPEGGELQGGATGAIGGGVFGFGIPAIAETAGWLAKTGPIRALLTKLGDERGALDLSALPKQEQDKLAAVLYKYSGATPGELQQALSRFTEARAKGVPLFLPEAIDKPTFYGRIRAANIEPAAKNIMAPRIEARAERQAARMADIFNTMSPETSAYKAGKQIKTQALELLEQAKKERKEVAGPLYNQAYESAGIVNDPELNQFLTQSKVLQNILKNPPDTSEYAGLPINHLKILDFAKRKLGDKVAVNKRAGALDAAQRYEVELNKFRGILDRIEPKYQQARNEYARIMRDDPRFNDDYLEIFSNLKENQLDTAGDKLFSLPPERISDVKTILGGDDNPAFGDLVRGYIQKVIDKRGEKADILQAPLFNTPGGQKKLKAAIGTESFDQLMDELKWEALIKKGQAQYFEGSSTAANITNMMRNAKDRSTAEKLFSTGPRQLIKQGWQKLTSPRGDILGERLADIATDPELGYRFLSERLIPFAQEMAPYEARARGLILGGQKIAESSEPAIAGDVLLNALLGNL